MPAACGISCEVCGCLSKGLCLTNGCAPGSKAQAKLEAQRAALKTTCPILECAFKHGIDYCSRDCPRFPCEIYYETQVPYSSRFLDLMREAMRRAP
ncbi:MAG: hypothetical protein N3H31_03700 [Candidatus Nezhaarchaeota archaeon]|nr:hypothetical protein [Candidatus Nezhaarchaeota archaeon]